ncbi:MAG: hypothetical protein Q8K36_02665, partial [Alphaproteobacteria bacterium]|nr:hypothetical protein [Alphaproteobacteria bacterium]
DKNAISEKVQKLGKGGAYYEQDNPLSLLRLEMMKLSIAESIPQVRTVAAEKITSKDEFIKRLSSSIEEFSDLIADVRTDEQLPNSNFHLMVQNMMSNLEKDLNSMPELSGTGELYNAKVVDFSLLIAAPNATLTDHSYALGGDQGEEITIDHQGTTMDIAAITAKDPAIEKFIRAMRFALQGDPDDPSDSNFTDALNLIDEASIHVTKTKEYIALQSQTLKKAIMEMERDLSELEEKYEGLHSISLPRSYAELEALKAQLDLITQLRINEGMRLSTLHKETQRIFG